MTGVQGQDDEYGRLAQIDGIARRVPQTEWLALADCRHSPQRDQRGALIQAVGTFLRSHADPAHRYHRHLQT